MEGHTYPCAWTKRKGIYILCYIAKAEILAEAKDFSEASELLADKICAAFGDGEAVLEFDPQPPIEAQLKIWTTPKILAFGYNNRVESDIEEEGMFSDGVCPRCGFARGMRTAKPLVIKGEISNHIACISGSRPALLVFSEAILGLFKQEELKQLTIRPVQSAAKLHKRFFEVSGKPDIKLVGFRDAEYKPITNWKCSTCNRISLSPFHQRFYGTGINKFISKSDLTSPLASLFSIGLFKDDASICITEERWKELKQEPEAKRIIVNTVGIVQEKYLVRNPAIENDYPA